MTLLPSSSQATFRWVEDQLHTYLIMACNLCHVFRPCCAPWAYGCNRVSHLVFQTYRYRVRLQAAFTAAHCMTELALGFQAYRELILLSVYCWFVHLQDALVDFENIISMEPRNYVGDNFSRVTPIYKVTQYNVACCYSMLNQVGICFET